MVQLPDLGFGDLVAGVWDDRVGHVDVGLVVADILIGELVFEDGVEGGEEVEGALSLVVHGEGEDHDPGAGVEVADGELRRSEVTSLSRR